MAQKVCVVLKATNKNTVSTDPNVVVNLTIPAGLMYASSILEKGLWNGTDTQWEVGSVGPGQTVQGTFCFFCVEGEDDFVLMWNITGDLPDNNSVNNTGSIDLKPAKDVCVAPCPPCNTASPCDVRPIGQDITYPETIIDAKLAFDRLCDCGCQNNFILESEMNVSGTIDAATGIYQGDIANQSLPFSIEVSLQCINCPGKCQPTTIGPIGPYTITKEPPEALCCTYFEERPVVFNPGNTVPSIPCVNAKDTAIVKLLGGVLAYYTCDGTQWNLDMTYEPIVFEEADDPTTVDADPFATKFVCDSNGNLQGVVKYDGTVCNVSGVSAIQNDDITTVTPNGTVQIVYDSNNNIIGSVLEDGTIIHTNSVLFAEAEDINTVIPDLNHPTFVCDMNDNLIGVVKSDGTICGIGSANSVQNNDITTVINNGNIQVVYDDNNEIVGIVTENGDILNTDSILFVENDDINSVTPDPNNPTFVCDTNGNLIGVVQEDGTICGVGGANSVQNNDITTVVNNGNVQVVYDDNFNIVGVVTENGDIVYTDSIIFVENDDINSVTPDPNNPTFVCDTNGNLIGVVQEDGTICNISGVDSVQTNDINTVTPQGNTTVVYDDDNEIIGVVLSDGTILNTNSVLFTQNDDLNAVTVNPNHPTFVCDTNGNLIGVVQEDGTICQIFVSDYTDLNPLGGPMPVQTIGTIDVGDGIENINETVTYAEYQGNGVHVWYNEQGNPYTLDLCNPDCPPANVAAQDDSQIVDSCAIFYGSVLSLVTPCDRGNTIIKLVQGSEVGLSVVVGANGEYGVTFDACPGGQPSGQFSYIAECDDGTIATGTVTFTPNLAESADSNDDNYAGPKNTPITGSVIGNDTPCAVGTTTFELNTPATNGAVSLGTNGSFSYIPMYNFTGSDSFTYNILCNGIVYDTSTVNIYIPNASAMDDVDIVPADVTTTGLDATDDDTGCSPGAITTYQWSNPAHPNAFGTITGTPDNFSYTPDPGFCGVGFTQYDLLCDGVVFDTATHYLYVTCAQPVDDMKYGLLDTPSSINVSTNDFTCINGGVTSFHLDSNPAANGAGLSEPTGVCNPGVGIGLIEPDVTVTSWNQATGQAVITPTNGWQGEVCFEYFIRCTTPNGVYESDPVNVTFVIEPPEVQQVSGC